MHFPFSPLLALFDHVVQSKGLQVSFKRAPVLLPCVTFIGLYTLLQAMSKSTL